MFRDDVMTVYRYIEVHHPSLQGTCSHHQTTGKMVKVYIIRVCEVHAAIYVALIVPPKVYIIRV